MQNQIRLFLFKVRKEASKEQRVAQKAIVHIDENLGYAEVNYGSTIYPISEQRFFTNELRTKTLKWMGWCINEIESDIRVELIKDPMEVDG